MSGQPRIIKSTEQLYELFKDYVLHVKSNPYIVVDYVGKDAIIVNRMKERPLTLMGFEVYVTNLPGMPYTLDDYMLPSGPLYAEFLSVSTRIRKQVGDEQISGGMAGMYNSSLTSRLNGLVERTEVKTIVEQPLFGDEPTEA